LIISEKLDQNTRSTLQQIRRETSLTSRQLAETAGVPLRTEYMMEIGGHVAFEDAIKVLDALSQLTGRVHTLEELHINLASEITPLP